MNSNLKLIFTSLMMCVGLMANAVPAKPGLTHKTQLADGTIINVTLAGDEHCHWWESPDGGKYVQLENKQEFRQIESEEFARMAARAQMTKASQRNSTKSKFGTGGVINDPSLFRGTKRAVVILAQFSDKKFSPSHDLVFYKNIINGKNYSDSRFSGSVRDYFYAQSRGLFDLQFDVVGPVTLPNP